MKTLFWLAAWVVLESGAFAQDGRITPPLPDPPKPDATSYLLQDFHSDAILVGHDIDARVEPASITKIMTAYVVFHELEAGNLGLDDMVTVSEKAWRMGGSKMFVEVGSEVSIEDLLRGMIVQSGNDASIALAEAVAGSESAFAGLMNSYAGQLGMQGTHYTNATGWPDAEHYTSAADTARLARALIDEFPGYYAYFAEREFTYNGITQPNRNRLLFRGHGVDGLKTGHTESAGYCLAASALQDGTRLITVVMGAESDAARIQHTLELLSYGQRFYTTRLVQAGGEPLGRVRVWKGGARHVGLQIEDDLYVTVPKRDAGELQYRVRIAEPVLAPIAGGQELGVLQVMVGDEVIREQPLLAAGEVPQAGLLSRWWDGLKLWAGAADAGGDDE